MVGQESVGRQRRVSSQTERAGRSGQHHDEEFALRLNAGDFASQSKAKAKPQRRDSAGSSTIIFSIGNRTWTDVEPGEYSISDDEVSKQLIRLLRHGSLPRDDDGAIDFWRIKDDLQKHFLNCHHWSDEKWKNSMARGGGNKNIYQYCTASSEEILYLQALQGHSGRCFTGQCHYSGRFLHVHLSFRMCNQFTFHH